MPCNHPLGIHTAIFGFSPHHMDFLNLGLNVNGWCHQDCDMVKTMWNWMHSHHSHHSHHVESDEFSLEAKLGLPHAICLIRVQYEWKTATQLAPKALFHRCQKHTPKRSPVQSEWLVPKHQSLQKTWPRSPEPLLDPSLSFLTWFPCLNVFR